MLMRIREQKGWILDEFCAATGYNRKLTGWPPRKSPMWQWKVLEFIGSQSGTSWKSGLCWATREPPLDGRFRGNRSGLLNQRQPGLLLPQIHYVANPHHLVLGHVVGDFHAMGIFGIPLDCRSRKLTGLRMALGDLREPSGIGRRERAQCQCSSNHGAADHIAWPVFVEHESRLCNDSCGEYRSDTCPRCGNDASALE